jgi:hypothetical protein
MSTVSNGTSMLKGEVRGIRELKRGVQAQVCLGSSVEHGSAVVVVETASPLVMEALKALKGAIRGEALSLTRDVLGDQVRWDEERAG